MIQLTALILIFFFFTFDNLYTKEKNNSDSTETLIPFRKGKLWGYANLKKELVIPVKYSGAEVFNDYGLAKVFTGDYFGHDAKFGMIDKKGNVVIPIDKYYSLNEIRDSVICFAKVFKDSIKYGVMDLKGNVIILPTFESPINFNHNAAIINTRKNFRHSYSPDADFIVINKKGEILTSKKYARISPFVNGFAAVATINDSNQYRYGVIDSTGKEIIPPLYNEMKCDFSEVYIDSNSFKNGLIAVKFGGFLEPKWGVINIKNEIVIDFQYDVISNYINGLFIVGIRSQRPSWYTEPDLYGSINVNNDTIVPFKYKVLHEFYGNLLIAQKGDKYGIINSKNETIVPFQYNIIIKLGEGFAETGINKPGNYKGRYWGIINFLGQEVIPPKFDNIQNQHNGYFEVEQNSKKGLYDYLGKQVLPIVYTECFGCSDSKYFIVMNENEKMGIVDDKNKIVLPFQYDFLFQDSSLGNGIFGIVDFKKTNNFQNIKIFEFIDKNKMEFFEE